MKYTKKQIKKAVAAAVTEVCHRVEGMNAADALAAAPVMIESVMAHLGDDAPEKPEKGKLLGERGIDAAQKYLDRKGYLVVDREWECDEGVADLVAYDGETLVFVEVNTRSDLHNGFPGEYSSEDKRDRMERIAIKYVAAHDVGERMMRFDVVSLCVVAKDRAIIRHHLGAYSR